MSIQASSYAYKDPLFSMGKVRVMFPICSTAIRQHNVPPSLLKGGVEMEVFSFRPSLYEELFSAHAETTCLKNQTDSSLAERRSDLFVGGGLFWVPKTMGTTSERRTIKVGNGTFAIHKKVRQKAFMPIFAFHGTTTLFMAFPWVHNTGVVVIG